jgi:microcompartment protein CcmK/EutM
VEANEELQRLDLVVGRVTAAAAHAGARGQSALLTLDLGPRGEAEAALPVALEAAEALVGGQVVCAVGSDAVAVLTVHSHGAGVVVVGPAQEVEDGSPVA